MQELLRSKKVLITSIFRVLQFAFNMVVFALSIDSARHITDFGNQATVDFDSARARFIYMAVVSALFMIVSVSFYLPFFYRNTRPIVSVVIEFIGAAFTLTIIGVQADSWKRLLCRVITTMKDSFVMINVEPQFCKEGKATIALGVADFILYVVTFVLAFRTMKAAQSKVAPTTYLPGGIFRNTDILSFTSGPEKDMNDDISRVESHPAQTFDSD